MFNENQVPGPRRETEKGGERERAWARSNDARINCVNLFRSPERRAREVPPLFSLFLLLFLLFSLSPSMSPFLFLSLNRISHYCRISRSLRYCLFHDVTAHRIALRATRLSDISSDFEATTTAARRGGSGSVGKISLFKLRECFSRFCRKRRFRSRHCFRLSRGKSLPARFDGLMSLPRR